MQVERIPDTLATLSLLLEEAGCFPQNYLTPESEKSVKAVTVDFFQPGSFSPALTLPFPPQLRQEQQPKDHNDGCSGVSVTLRVSTEGGVLPADCVMRSQASSQGGVPVGSGVIQCTQCAPGPGGSTAGEGGDRGWGGERRQKLDTPNTPDTESVACFLWLQGDAEVIVETTNAISTSGSNQGVETTKVTPSEGEGLEGVFQGLERLVVPAGAVMVWDSSANPGLQVAVPRSNEDRVLLTFQCLTPRASHRVTSNARERAEARQAATLKKKAQALAKETKNKGPIPGIPVEEKWPGFGLCSEGVNGGDGFGSGIDVDGECGSTPAIEREHVQAVYDTIATHWSHTRYKPWPKVEAFLSSLPYPALVADTGCGNGKYLGCGGGGRLLIGSDSSVPLLSTSIERLPQAEVCAADCMNLPYRSGIFDAALSIAVLHHFSTEARRVRAIRELARVLRPGGQVLIYAWAMEQDRDSRRSFSHQDVLVPWHLGDQHTSASNVKRVANKEEMSEPSQGQEKHGANVNIGHARSEQSATVSNEEVSSTSHQEQQTKQGGTDCSFPPPTHGVRVEGPGSNGKGGSVVYQRYCHVYREGELEKLVQKNCTDLHVLKSYYDRSNWCVLAEKEASS
ncbi:unnamed protein product [Choristocarpus tenellus]